MKKYEVDITINGVTSAIDTIIASDNYSAENYIKDCENNADNEYCEMLKSGEISLVEID